MVIITTAPRFFRRSRVAALLLSLLMPLPAFSDVPRGVFCLMPSSTGGAGKDPAVYSDPNIDGISTRQKWCDLEPSEGVFDFSFLDTVTSKAAAGGKKVALRIGTSGGSAETGGNTPNWVFDAIKAEPLPNSQKFFTFNDGGTSRTIPVFWDPVYLAKKKAMIRALGAHFANNPAVKIVSASFANAQSEDWAVPHTSQEVTDWLSAGYTTEKMLDAGRQIIDTTMSAFSYQYVALAVGGNGHTGGLNLDPDENYVARNAVLMARAAWPGRLIVQKNTLATFTPPAPGTGTLYQIVWGSAPDIAGQMLYWCYGDSSYRVNGGVPIDPAKALSKSVDIGIGYGLKYIEIYRVDILNLPGAVKYAHDALVSATPPSPSSSPTPSPTPTPDPSPSATPSSSPSPTPTPIPAGAYCDLKISMTNSETTVVAGQKSAYTITVTNTGRYGVTGALVSDVFPSTFTGVTFTATQVGGASGFTASGIGNINDTVTVPVGGFITYKATGVVSSAAVAAISNTATITPPSGLTEIDSGDNSAGVTIPITLQADVRVRVDNWDSTVFVGQTNTYRIVVVNAGPSDVAGAVIKDNFPNAFTNVTFTATAEGGASGFSSVGAGDINDTVRLPAGSHIIYKARGTINSSATGTLSNTATVLSPSGVRDSDLSNNTATDTDRL